MNIPPVGTGQSPSSAHLWIPLCWGTSGEWRGWPDRHILEWNIGSGSQCSFGAEISDWHNGKIESPWIGAEQTFLVLGQCGLWWSSRMIAFQHLQSMEQQYAGYNPVHASTMPPTPASQLPFSFPLVLLTTCDSSLSQGVPQRPQTDHLFGLKLFKAFITFGIKTVLSIVYKASGASYLCFW